MVMKMKKKAICICLSIIFVLCIIFSSVTSILVVQPDINMNFVDPSKPMVALTYDDGPYSAVTDRILDVLQEYNSRATFFIVGDRIEKHPETLKRMYEQQHELGHHTYSHIDMTSVSASELQNQFDKTEKLLKELVNENINIKIVRPVFGNTNKSLASHINYPMILWSIDTLDWSHKNTSRTVEEVKKEVSDGDIILMHDLFEPTAKATEQLVPYLIEQGYQIVTISELFMYKNIKLENGMTYRDAIVDN